MLEKHVIDGLDPKPVFAMRAKRLRTAKIIIYPENAGQQSVLVQQ